MNSTHRGRLPREAHPSRCHKAQFEELPKAKASRRKSPYKIAGLWRSASFCWAVANFAVSGFWKPPEGGMPCTAAFFATWAQVGQAIRNAAIRDAGFVPRPGRFSANPVTRSIQMAMIQDFTSPKLQVAWLKWFMKVMLLIFARHFERKQLPAGTFGGSSPWWSSPLGTRSNRVQRFIIELILKAQRNLRGKDRARVASCNNFRALSRRSKKGAAYLHLGHRDCQMVAAEAPNVLAICLQIRKHSNFGGEIIWGCKILGLCSGWLSNPTPLDPQFPRFADFDGRYFHEPSWFFVGSSNDPYSPLFADTPSQGAWTFSLQPWRCSASDFRWPWR